MRRLFRLNGLAWFVVASVCCMAVTLLFDDGEEADGPDVA